jgi:hypothetical protein
LGAHGHFVRDRWAEAKRFVSSTASIARKVVSVSFAADAHDWYRPICWCWNVNSVRCNMWMRSTSKIPKFWAN